MRINTHLERKKCESEQECSYYRFNSLGEYSNGEK